MNTGRFSFRTTGMTAVLIGGIHAVELFAPPWCGCLSRKEGASAKLVTRLANWSALIFPGRTRQQKSFTRIDIGW